MQLQAGKLAIMSPPYVHFYQIPVGTTVPLIKPIQTDGIVVFWSSELNLDASSKDFTQINLIGSNNAILLHMSFRVKENVIVFNSRTIEGTWLEEQRIKLTGAFGGQNIAITVFDHGDQYQVLMDGETKIYYNKQLKGDVTGLGYLVKGELSIFSSTIAAQTFNNIAALIPGSA